MYLHSSLLLKGRVALDIQDKRGFLGGLIWSIGDLCVEAQMNAFIVKFQHIIGMEVQKRGETNNQ
jgi:hypothetical protein